MYSLAEKVIAALTTRGMRIATCESLTGGLICASLVDVPGASRVVRGGLITYQTDTKSLLADVPAALIDAHGVVSAQVASAMAEGVRRRLDVDVAVSATGMASPGTPEDPPAGTVFVGVSTGTETRVAALHLAGSREEIRRETVRRALLAVLDML